MRIVYTSFTRQSKKQNKILFTQICHEDEQANIKNEDSLGFFISHRRHNQTTNSIYSLVKR
jgi:hypothetical protein